MPETGHWPALSAMGMTLFFDTTILKDAYMGEPLS